MRRGGIVALGAVIGWYAFALAVLHPLADGPVVDSWIYAEAARWFRVSGEIRFPGYTESMPVPLVFYGAAWGSIFGNSAVSFDLANVALAIIAALLLYVLAIRCGARSWQALSAAGVLICNPCFLFLSFSFMSEIAFLAALIASHVAFAKSESGNQLRLLWLAAILGVVAFAVRPFGGAALLGSIAAISIFDVMLATRTRPTLSHLVAMLVPFAIAILGCGLIWMWLTVWRPPPWKLVQRAGHFTHIFEVPSHEYLRMGVLGPLLYLGIVLSPMALLQVVSENIARKLGIGLALFLLTLILVRAGIPLPATPEMSCFGGWSNALILRGMPERFEWHSAWQYAFMLLGSIGGAGLIFATIEVMPRLTRASAAVLITAAIYWAAMIPLWFFNDRYYLVLLPAAALILALAPMPQSPRARIAALAMTAVMGLMSLGGTYSYQRGLAEVIAARDLLVKQGVKRADIDAGYELNGLDLYKFARTGGESPAETNQVPMITSSKLEDYTIAAAPVPGTTVEGTISRPGPFGFGSREIYLLRRMPNAASSPSQ